MNSSKTSGFSSAELESLSLWHIPDAFEEEAEEPVAITVVEDFEPEAMAVLTVDEIEAMQKQAYDEAFVQGKNDGYNQGYQENVQALQKQAADFASLLESLSEPFKALDAEVEKELVKLAIAMATQIIRREIKLDPGQIIAVVREAIYVLPLSAQKISVRLHPEDAELVRSTLLLDELHTAWKIIEDPLITRGGCQVDTDVSHVDATLENRLATVIATVLGGEREQDKQDKNA